MRLKKSLETVVYECLRAIQNLWEYKSCVHLDPQLTYNATGSETGSRDNDYLGSTHALSPARTANLRPMSSQAQTSVSHTVHPTGSDGITRCHCNEETPLRTAGDTAKNPGRRFYSCNKNRDDETRCKFFGMIYHPFQSALHF